MPDWFSQRGALVLRILVSALLLGVVLAYANVGEMAQAIREGSWGWFVAALALMAGTAVIGAVRWRMLLQHAEIEVSEVRALRTFAGAAFLNNVLPTSVGGDAVRAWLVGRESGRLARATAATVVDKVTALACLFVLAWAALAIDREGVPGSIIGVLAWVTAGVLGALAVAVLAAAGARPIVRRLPQRFAGLTREVWSALRGWAGSATLIAWLLGLGVAYGGSGVLVFILVGKAVGVELSFSLVVAVTPVVLVAMLIPVSIGGLGVREGGFVLLLGEAGFGAAEATLVSLLSAAAILLATGAVVAATAAYDAVRVRGAKATPVARQPQA